MNRIQRFSLTEIAEICAGQLSGDKDAGRVVGVSTDSRTVKPGELFVALMGPSFDGHQFVDVAREKGAVAVLVSRPVVCELPQIRVPDTLLALQALGRAIFESFRAQGVPSVALTGSNGKTTTKELIASLLGTCGKRVHATPGNLNNHIGVPLTLCAAPDDAEALVLEMGCNRFRDISELIAIAPCDVRVVTSIGYAHVEVLGDLDGVRRAKSEIFEQANQDTVAVVPFDERDRLLLRGFPGRVVTAGFAQGADLVVRTQPEAGAQRVTLVTDDGELELTLPLPGAHNAQNLALAWMAVERGLGLALDARAVGRGFSGFALPGGRLKRFTRGHWDFVDDAYNANPTSARASYEAFLELLGPAPRIAVLGEMRELGQASQKLHADLARYVAAKGGADVLVFVGPFASEMETAAHDVGAEATVFAAADVATAAEFVKSQGPGFVLLKASRGAKLERMIDLIEPKA